MQKQTSFISSGLKTDPIVPEDPRDFCRILINPSRRPGAVKHLLSLLEKQKLGKIILSKSPEHFSDEVVGFCESSDRHLLVWGGDGTVHSAMNSLMTSNYHGKTLGFFRGGSGNGIQDSYEVPSRLSAQVKSFTESLEKKRFEQVDIIKISWGNTVVYGQLFGVGFDVEVLKRRNAMKNKKSQFIRSGLLPYLTAGLAQLFSQQLSEQEVYDLELKNGKFSFRGPRINAEYPFENLNRKSPALLLAVGTRPYYGKLFKICPDVVCNDGFLDVYLYHFHSIGEVLRNALAIWEGRHSAINTRLAKKSKPVIERYEVENLTIKVIKSLDFHIDGELYHAETGQDLRFEVLPRALEFIVPETFYRKFHPFYDEPELYGED